MVKIYLNLEDALYKYFDLNLTTLVDNNYRMRDTYIIYIIIYPM